MTKATFVKTSIWN